MIGGSSAPDALSDDELAALALAADPDAGIPDDALPIHVHLAAFGSPSLRGTCRQRCREAGGVGSCLS